MIIISESRAKRIIPTVVLGFLVLLTYFLIFSYRSALAEAENATLMRLGGIVNSMALQIDGDVHQHLTMQYLQKDEILVTRQDSNYLKIHDVLKNNYEANMLHTPIYTIIFDSLSKKYVFGITSSEKPYYRHAYNSAPKELMEKHYEGAMIPMYNDEFGTWLSAFAAIKNKRGEVVALVQADEKFDDFIQRARQNVFKNLLFGLLVFGVFLVVLVRILQPIIRKEQQDKEELSAANQQIKQLDNFRKEMIANISHDLRTPMSSILGYAEILLQKKSQLSDNEQDKYLNIISMESKRLNSMVSELFDLSKLEAGQIVLDKELFNIKELAQDILYLYDLRAKEKNVRLLSQLQDNLPLVEVDIRWMDRVIQNLLDNAIKYVEEGGFAQISIFSESGLLHFKVCNSGKPIKKEHLPNIFDRYFKSENKNIESTGLGLAIVKKIIDLHGGRIWVESNEELTTFRFSLKI